MISEAEVKRDYPNTAFMGGRGQKQTEVGRFVEAKLSRAKLAQWNGETSHAQMLKTALQLNLTYKQK